MRSAATTFSCPACGQRFIWRDRYANRRFACACGNVMFIPGSAQLAADDAELPEPQPVRLAIDPLTAELIAPPAPPPPVLDYSSAPDAVAVRSDRHAVSNHVRDIWLPVWVIASGLLLLMLLVVVMASASATSTRSAHAMAVNLALRLAWEIGVTFIGGMLITGLLDCSLGQIAAATLKLTAIAVARFAVASLFNIPIDHIGGALLGLMASMPIFAGLISYFFELDVRDTTFAVVLLTLLRAVSYFGMWKLL
ncbi:hypothetical protein [Fontivita pretiosa]|jgi:hypothetical protein|uniref:hypothetical protein n=1 Tax=Fontivita pretiosa TaxID=2989684 RepID=UPI003D16B3D2